QERYMGLPRDNAEGYRIGSSINFAEGLKGKLLIVHGSGDDNVHYQGTERLVNRLIELGKPFDLMVYPNRTHAIAEGPGTTTHVPEISRFLGIVIGMFFREHGVPHFHAVYGEHKITVEIESGTVRGTFPTRALRLVLEWASLHKSELLANWDRARQRQPLVRI